MKKFLLIVLVLLSFSGRSQNKGLFEKGNENYAQGNYEAALENYQKILDRGEASVAVYYNLANAHYKLNHIAPSIYFYEKALQLKPNDQDVKNNIRFARNMALDDIKTVEETGLQKNFNALISKFSFNSWAKIAIGFSVLFVILFLLYFYSRSSLPKRIFFGTALLAVLLCLTSIFFAYRQQQIGINNQFAIIFKTEAAVRNEPNLRGDSAFTLHEGTKVKILENYQGWKKIQLADGTQGWTKHENLREL